MYWNNVETQPGRGYPKDYMDYNAGWDDNGNLKSGGIPNVPEDYGTPWEYNYEKLVQGADKTLKPDVEPSWGANWDEDVGDGEYPNSYHIYLPRICNHCTNPACLAACPNEAIRKRESDGVVLVDLKICEGVMACISSCPYKKVYYNSSRKNDEKKIDGQSEKCIFCFPRMEKGLPPACAKQCVGRIRHVGYMDDEDSHVYKLVKKWKVALPLRADFGTMPNVYYVPPLSPPKFNEHGEVMDEPRIPLSFLQKLFGSSVERTLETLKVEMDKKSRGENSEVMDILIAYKHSDMFKV
jgi:complex iron-sulfur molybdoenzyme family reductase subunit beta|tara:strand:+ start:36354 stop:37241 length:888 start_codon:yes stop_codon:yes gene_type:complete